MNRLTLIIVAGRGARRFRAGRMDLSIQWKGFHRLEDRRRQITFTIKDGAMVANGPVAHAFYDGPVNNHDFKNFELMVDVMAAPNSNGGIYFHTEFQDTRFPAEGLRSSGEQYLIGIPLRAAACIT